MIQKKFSRSTLIVLVFIAIVSQFAPLMAQDVKDDITNRNPIDQEFTYKGEKISFLTDAYYFETSKENDYNIEVWYQIPNKNLLFIPPKGKETKNKLEAHLLMAVNTYSEGKKIENLCIFAPQTFPLEDEKQASEPGKSIMGSFNFTIPSGIYVIKVGITDVEAKKIGIEKIKIEIPPYDKTKLMFSAFKFADKMEEPLEKAEEDIYLVSNINKRIFPNLERKYKTESDFIFYYEIYNLATTSDGKSKFEISYAFNRLEKPAKEGDPEKIIKCYKKKITCPEDAQGTFSPQSYMFKLFKEIEDPKTKTMRPLFVLGQYEMIVDLVDLNRKAGEQERGVKFNFTITE